ncbi:GAF domain-containing protein [Deinococcus navajonensis]|uniref:histidine kinase n=1 Tax=Deinococcus navajonensis TaxID=309884 RepID=A0ABV8XNM2_9DEIO
MCSQSAALSMVPLTPSERLQAVTEALAAARSRKDVFGIVLTPALQALDAVAGAVLLVDGGGRHLTLAATQGHEEDAQTLWQDGSLEDSLPAGAALTRREPLFFEHEGDLLRAYPHLEDRTGDVAPVATAVLPMFLDERPLGVIVLDFKEPHEFTAEEQRFLRILAAQCAIALGRVELLTDLQRQVQERTRKIEADAYAQEAFVAFTEAVGTETDVLTLAELAIAVLSLRFPDSSSAYSQLDEGLWKLGAHSSDLHDHPRLLQRLRSGLPRDTPVFAQALSTRAPVFVNAWAAQGQIEHTEAYGTLANYPLVLAGEVRAILSLGLKRQQQWAERDQAVFRAVGRSLSLALERTEYTRLLQARSEEEARRSQVLRAFAELSRDLVLDTDPYMLIRRTQEAVLDLLPAGASMYFEPEDGFWRLKSQVGQAPAETARALQDDCAPFEAARDLLMPYQSGVAHYRDEHDPQADQQPGGAGSAGGMAVLPVMVGGATRGVLGFALHTAQRWSGEDRAVLETVGRQLTLALERAEQTHRLAVQKAELEARNKALEAFEEWSRDLTLDAAPFALISRALDLLYTLLSLDAALYYELEGERWQVRSMRGEYGSPGLQQAHEAGLPHATTDNLRIAFETGEPYYQDVYDTATDGLAGHMEHVSATAMLPLRTLRGVRGILGLGKFSRSGWTSIERTTLETVRRSLELALDRADQMLELAQERSALKTRTDELADANEELEAFSYSVSHDLRTPVRHVLNFNQLLRRQLGEGLDTKSTRYLTVVDEAAGRMNTLIDAMLNLSRTSRLPLRLGPVDLGALVEAVRAELEADVLDRRVEWRIHPLPRIDGDEDTLRQVVTNLLDNALKYTRTREVAQIEVSADERSHEWVVSVRDNGVGFDPRYANKLFGVFQRLHRTEDFEGTGVGLANVRRIVARHNGKVWASGTPGAGATFSFTLPKPG